MSRIGAVLALAGALAATTPQADIFLDRPILSMGQEGTGRTFTSIRDYQKAQGGRYYLLDSNDPFVAVYDSSGRFLFEFGRRGQGPGELLRPVRLWNVSGITLILDTYLNRISEFDASGQFIRSCTSDYNMLDIAVTADTVYVSVIHPSALVITKSRRDLEHERVILRYNDIPQMRTAQATAPLDSEPLTLCLHGSTLIGAASTSAILVTHQLDHTGGTTVVQVTGKSIDAFVDHYIQEHGDWRIGSRIGTALPLVLRRVHSWQDGNLITDAHTYEKGIRYRSMAIIIDPETGKETGTRIGSVRENLYHFKLIGSDCVSAIKGDLATLEIFRIK